MLRQPCSTPGHGDTTLALFDLELTCTATDGDRARALHSSRDRGVPTFRERWAPVGRDRTQDGMAKGLCAQ